VKIKIIFFRLLSVGIFLTWTTLLCYVFLGFCHYPKSTLKMATTIPGLFFVIIPFLLWIALRRYRKGFDPELHDDLTIIGNKVSKFPQAGSLVVQLIFFLIFKLI